MSDDYQGTLEEFDKVDVLEKNNAITLKTHENVKGMSNDYQGALENVDKVDILQPNNAFIL
jgi:hypothetical protein